jgi:hypothetical protein
MEQVKTWYDPSTQKWITYSGEFNTYAEAWKNR